MKSTIAVPLLVMREVYSGKFLAADFIVLGFICSADIIFLYQNKHRLNDYNC
jgi:hypothetical protein